MFGNITIVNASLVSDLTWSNFPSGWAQNNDNITGESTDLIIKSVESGDDFEYKVDITLNGSGNQASQGGLLIRASGQSYSNSYIVMLHKTPQLQRIEIHKFDNGTDTIIGTADKTINWNQTYNLKVKAEGNNIKIYYNNEDSPCVDVNDSTLASGQFGLFRAGTKVTFNNIIVNDDPLVIFKEDFNNGTSSLNAIEGTWNVVNNQLQGSSGQNQNIRVRKQGVVASDFVYEADITLDTESSAGILSFRGDDNMDNTYCVALDSLNNIVKLYKFPYASISEYNYNFQVDNKYHLKVKAIGNKIQVYLDDNNTPVIDVVDNSYTSGQFGLFNYNGKSTFDNFIATQMSSSNELPEPKHHWRFENNLSDDKNLANGVATSSPVYTIKDVISGSTGLYMDGKDDVVNFNDVEMKGSFTISFWVKPSDIHKDWTPILSKFGIGGNTFWIGNHAIDGRIRFGVYSDGNTERYIDTDWGTLVDSRWAHITCSYDGHYQKVYLNGSLIKQSGDINAAITNKVGEFKIGHRIQLSDNVYNLPYKGSIDDVRYYDSALSDLQVKNLFSSYNISAGQDVSLIIDQAGYRPSDRKMAVFRSTKRIPNWNPENATFKIKKKQDHSVVKTGSITYWGTKWGSHWWIGDFNDYDTEGEYYFEVCGNNMPLIRSNYFKISDDLLTQNGIIQAQIDNLKSRIVKVDDLHDSSNPPYLESGVIYKVDFIGTYALDKGIHIYRDCGASNMTELESATITGNALLDILEYQDNVITDQQRNEINDLIKLTANYLVDIQETSSDSQKNGRMHHMGMGWSQEEIKTFSWRDMPHAIVTLVRSYKLFKDTNPTLANKWLDSAKLAYNCMTFRPYYLLSELSGPEVSSPSWNYNTLMKDLRYMYDKSSNWTMPRNNTITDLRTRDIMPAIWACTQLYSVDSQHKYLDKAEEFTNIISDRQFIDYNNKIENTYGNFYEFSNDKTTFVVEMHQYARWSMGNYDPVRLNGIMELFNYRPDSTNAAKWYNTIKMYGENYVKQFDNLTPFGIIPLRMDNNGMDFYRPINHGANSIYGLAAINILEIGNFLNDKEYQDIAARNINYITGMNPGWPNKGNIQATDWGAFSWAAGIGEVSFGGNVSHYVGGILPRGSIPNGFTSNALGSINDMGTPDGPYGIYSGPNHIYRQEDGVMHSLSFLNGVTRIETNHLLKINTKNNNQPVVSNIKVIMDSNTYNYSTDSTGKCEINNLPTGKSGMLYATYGNVQLSKKVDTLSSGYMEWNVDFANYIDVSVSVPQTISKNTSGNCTVTITNHGAVDTTANVSLSADGVSLSTTSFSKLISANSSESEVINFSAGNVIKDYLVCTYVETDNNTTVSTASGKIN
jgi:hypothetical protein